MAASKESLWIEHEKGLYTLGTENDNRRIKQKNISKGNFENFQADQEKF